MGVDDLFIETGLRHVDENFLVFLEAVGAVQARFEFVWKATLTAKERESQQLQKINVKTTTSGKSLKSI